MLTEGYLVPHTRRALRDGRMSTTEAEEMKADFDRITEISTIDSVVIWNLKREAIYSSIGTITEDMFQQTDYQLALHGGSSHVEVTDLDEVGRHDTGPPPYLEFYAPIRITDTGELIVLSETLMDISQMLVTRQQAALSVLIATTFTGLALCSLAALILLQHQRLLQHLTDEEYLLLHDNRLRQFANKVRVLASQSNEALLNQLGAEIHDGPVQILSLLILSNDLDERRPSEVWAWTASR